MFRYIRGISVTNATPTPFVSVSCTKRSQNVFFLAGKDYINQIKLIVGVIGSPAPELLKLCQSEIIKKFILRM